MSSAIFYRTALDRDLSEGTRQLFESLMIRNEQIEEMLRTLPGQRRANQSRREGRAVEQSSAERAAKEEADAQIPRMEGMVKMLVTLISSEKLLLKTALESENSSLKHERELHEDAHPEDFELGRPMIELREANIRDLKTFKSGV